MEPPSQVPLSGEDQRFLRSFVSTNQRTRWQDWSFHGTLSLVFVSWVVGCQLLIRWLPAHLEARGLTICLRHPSLHHGIQWLPDSLGFAELLRGPGAFGMLYAYAFGMVALVCYIQQRQARRVSRLLARLLPDDPVA